jgi:hypothetical protein
MIGPADSHEEALSIQWIEAVVKVVDPRWIERPSRFAGQRMWLNRHERLSVVCSAGPQRDGRRWLHFSCAGQSQVPTWEQFVRTKEAFLGPETKAIQVLAPRSQWVSIHPHCLHLWVCLDGDPLPDFTQGSGSI